jgi:sec-independent protein translocase protein TatA
MPFELGLPEVILVLVIALLFLGPKRLPEAGQALGKGIREFRDGLSGHGAPPEHVEPPPAPTAYTPPATYRPPGDHPTG